ncbi:MAG: hypothetical protein MZU91_04815 [Desulfosudis oleivorans]|nr:hypothetical protein [Desulfosudis oleivorans]
MNEIAKVYTKKMSLRNVLIINLTRMGDLIQTTPVMAALKQVRIRGCGLPLAGQR